MVCKNCGAQITDDSKFCTGCGAAISSDGSVGVVASSDYDAPTGSKGFVDDSEGGSFSLKNGRMMNVLSGEGFVKEDAVITNKRIYYSAKSGVIDVHLTEEVVDIEDVTGTKITDFKPYSFIVFSIIFIIAGIALIQTLAGGCLLGVGFVLFILFFILKKSHLRIEYAGGNINFSVKKYGLTNVRAFQHRIYIEKEKIRQERLNKG